MGIWRVRHFTFTAPLSMLISNGYRFMPQKPEKAINESAVLKGYFLKIGQLIQVFIFGNVMCYSFTKRLYKADDAILDDRQIWRDQLIPTILPVNTLSVHCVFNVVATSSITFQQQQKSQLPILSDLSNLPDTCFVLAVKENYFW